jgi:EAL domain-containing protein (putative c-di-GMP-specific phosphodiesterase class I)
MDMVKIDKSSVDGQGEKPEDTAIVEAVISFARALGLRTVAEGIETIEQLEQLRELGVRVGTRLLLLRGAAS